MPISISSIKAGRVALQTYTDPLTMRDLELLYDTMRDEYLAPATCHVHIIADFRAVQRPPIFLLARGASQLDRTHPNTGSIIGVLSNGLIYRMGLMFVSLVPNHTIILTRSLEDAMRIADDILEREQNEPSR